MSGYRDFPLSRDTTPESESLLFRILAKKTPAEKLKMVGLMNAAVRSLAMTGLRQRFPAESDRQLALRLAQLLYGSEMVERLQSHQRNER